MWDKICLMLPTYGRTGLHLPRFVNSAEAMSSKICFSFCVNEKDTATLDYLKTREWKSEYEIILETLPTPHLAKYFNMMYNNSKWKTEDGVVISQLGDDMEFKTPGWDSQILQSINYYDGIGVFYANDDLWGREKCCINLFVTRKMVALTEYSFMHELFPAEMIDVVWHEVGRLTKTLHFFPDIHITHHHGSLNPDACFNRLQPFRKEAHIIGKAKAKEIGAKIAAGLLKKGILGNSLS